MKRVISLFLTVLLALALTGCSKEELREWASDVIIDMATRFGFVTPDDDEEDADTTRAPKGGSIVLPEGWDPTGSRIVTKLSEGVLYVGFNGIQNRNTPYFVATAENMTLTCYATSTNTTTDTIPRIKAALWLLSEDEVTTSYVLDSTVYFSAGGEGVCYTQTVTGLIPGRRYKINISYDNTRHYVTGVLTATNVSDQPLVEIDNNQAA